jgi:hypothetical protein
VETSGWIRGSDRPKHHVRACSEFVRSSPSDVTLILSNCPGRSPPCLRHSAGMTNRPSSLSFAWKTSYTNPLKFRRMTISWQGRSVHEFSLRTRCVFFSVVSLQQFARWAQRSRGPKMPFISGVLFRPFQCGDSQCPESCNCSKNSYLG